MAPTTDETHIKETLKLFQKIVILLTSKNTEIKKNCFHAGVTFPFCKRLFYATISNLPFNMWPPFNRAYFVEVLIEGLFFFLNINVSLGYREAS